MDGRAGRRVGLREGGEESKWADGLSGRLAGGRSVICRMNRVTCQPRQPVKKKSKHIDDPPATIETRVARCPGFGCYSVFSLRKKQ